MDGEEEDDQRWNSSVCPLDKTPLAEYVACEFKVTTEYRGADVNGRAVGFSGEGDTVKIRVKFLPDDAHAAVDIDKGTKFSSRLGSSEALEKSKVKPGHSGAERPRNRTKEEIKAEGNLMRFAGVAYIYCSSCGIGVWEDPCLCYVNHKRKGWYCQKCGKRRKWEQLLLFRKGWSGSSESGNTKYPLQDVWV